MFSPGDRYDALQLSSVMGGKLCCWRWLVGGENTWRATVVWDTMLCDALQLHYERPSLLLVEGGRRKQGTPWTPLTPTYRKPALFLCYIVLLKTKQSLAQCVRNNRAQCVRHHPLGHSVRGVILLGTVCEAQYSSGTTSCDRTGTGRLRNILQYIKGHIDSDKKQPA